MTTVGWLRLFEEWLCSSVTRSTWSDELSRLILGDGISDRFKKIDILRFSGYYFGLKPSRG